MGINLNKGATNPIRCFPDLPDLIIAKISSSLPVKSIAQCRCVCKTWRHLISSSYFNNLILKKRSSLTFIVEASGYLLFPEKKSGHLLFEFQHRTDLTKTTYCPVKPMKLNSKLFPGELLVIGNCNGLLCLLDMRKKIDLIHIWNPVLSQYITFPIGVLKDTKPVSYGFGYNHTSNQYKVIRIVDRETYSVVEVLTVGPNTWRRVGNTHCRPNRTWVFCYFTGIVHWICGCRDDSHSEWICSFNISTGKQGWISLPLDCKDYRPGRDSLLLKVVRDCLCLLHYTPKGFVLWSMNNYGVAESWSKHVFLGLYPNSIGLVFVTTMWGNEEFLFLRHFDNLGYFDSKETRYVELKTTIDDSPIPKTAAYPFSPSFVPLFDIFKEKPSKMFAQN